MTKNKGRFSSRKGLVFFVKMKNKKGEVISKLSHKKVAVKLFFEANRDKFKEIYLKVTYKPGVYNDGLYHDNEYHELIRAWSAFTEEDLVRDAIENY